MRKHFVVFLIFLLILGMAGAVSAFNPDESEYLEFQSQVLSLVNIERARAGAPNLSMADAGARRAAMLRAYEISYSFMHTRPNGSGLQTLLFDNGVRCRRFGENIAYGYNSASSVMDAWMHSPTHRANVIQKGYTDLAVGVYCANGKLYWVQIFLTPVR